MASKATPVRNRRLQVLESTGGQIDGQSLCVCAQLLLARLTWWAFGLLKSRSQIRWVSEYCYRNLAEIVSYKLQNRFLRSPDVACPVDAQVVVNTLTNLHTDETPGSRLADFRMHVSVILPNSDMHPGGKGSTMMAGLDCELQHTLEVSLGTAGRGGKKETHSTV